VTLHWLNCTSSARCTCQPNVYANLLHRTTVLIVLVDDTVSLLKIPYICNNTEPLRVRVYNRCTADTLLSSAASRLPCITERIYFLQIPPLSSRASAEGLLLIVNRGRIPSHTVETRFIMYQIHDLTTPRTKNKTEASKTHSNTWLLNKKCVKCPEHLQ
jgi:hypothetical protein